MSGLEVYVGIFEIERQLNDLVFCKKAGKEMFSINQIGEGHEKNRIALKRLLVYLLTTSNFLKSSEIL